MKIIPIDIPELGNRSYIIHDGKVAIVVDPSRRTDQIISTAKNEGVEIKAIFETHIHNDYVTGGFALASSLGIDYYVSILDKVTFDRSAISPDQKVILGNFAITALGSPGHTFNHLSYLVEEPDNVAALFSGGSLLYGAVGRPDLISADSTAPLAKAQYETAQSFLERLDPDTLLYPTHGFGSFCAATQTESVQVSTLKMQLETNHAYLATDVDSFVSELIRGLDVYPAYYAYMAPKNLVGPLDPDLSKPSRLTPEKLNRAVHEGVAIVDTRTRTAYAANHMRGSYNIELNSDLATYVGWIVDWKARLIIIADSADEVSTVQEQLSLIGREKIAGYAQPEEFLESNGDSSYLVKTFANYFKEADQNAILIDVRRSGEWNKSHLIGSTNIPLHDLRNRAAEIPEGEIWVHCAGGFRASIAASILSGFGKNVVLINDQFSNVPDHTLSTV